MSQLLQKSHDVLILLADETRTDAERLWAVLPCLNGLTLTGLDPSIWPAMEPLLVECNAAMQILTETSSEASSSDDVDLPPLLDEMREMFEWCVDVELNRIVKALNADDRTLPRAAIEEAREVPERMIPRLIDCLKSVVRTQRSGETFSGNAPIFACYLLAEFKAVEAVPVYLDLLSLKGDQKYEAGEEALVAVIPHVLAGLAWNRMDLIDEFVQDPGHDLFARLAVANTYSLLIRDGRLSREEGISKLRIPLSRALVEGEKNADALLFNALLILELVCLGATGARGDIETAYARDLVDDTVVTWEEIQADLERPDLEFQQHIAKLPPTEIHDTIEELSGWACYASREEDPREARTRVPELTYTSGQATTRSAPIQPIFRPIVTANKTHTGRNDPCPCGSGKKFKKCCL